MRKSLWLIGLALAALSAPTALRAADITYTVYESVGAGMVTGSITTDGTVGTLATSDIVDWNLVLNDGTHPTFDLLGPLSGNNSQDLVFGADLTASLTQLLFNFSATDHGTFDIENPGLGLSGPVICYDANAMFCPTPNSVALDALKPESDIQSTSLTGTDVIASVGTTVATPEPGTGELMLIGVGLLGLMTVTRKRNSRCHQQTS
jgi:hypothetical protein